MIRVASTADSEALASVHVKSWRQAYAGLIPQWYLDGLDVGRRADSWRHVLQGTETAAFLDFDGEQLAGFAAVGACRDPDASESWGELAALYYLQPYWGKGRSSLLLSVALEELRGRSFDLVTLWVLHDNFRAISFYTKCGFRLDGAEKTDEREGFALRELRMCT